MENSIDSEDPGRRSKATGVSGDQKIQGPEGPGTKDAGAQRVQEPACRDTSHRGHKRFQGLGNPKTIEAKNKRIEGPMELRGSVPEARGVHSSIDTQEARSSRIQALERC